MYVHDNQALALEQKVTYEGIEYRVADIQIAKDFKKRYKKAILT